MTQRAAPSCAALRARARLVLLVIAIGSGGLACAPASSESQPRAAGEDFQAFWTGFRTAALANRTQDIAAMTRFPFEEKGVVDGIEPVSHTREAFLDRWNSLIAQDSGVGSSTMREFVAANAAVPERAVAPSGGNARMGMFEFERTSQGWRFTAAYVAD
jgi:hypothetical protein